MSYDLRRSVLIPKARAKKMASEAGCAAVQARLAELAAEKKVKTKKKKKKKIVSDPAARPI